jgi:UDP-N-acetylglucosamine 3-dehydrogenase
MKRIRIGVIGCGGMGSAHVKAIQANPEFEFVAGCDINSAALAELPGTVKRYNDGRQLIKNEKLDLVSIILPNYLYEPHVCMAAERGISVFCEKPFGKDLDSCHRMIKSLRDNGTRGWVSAQRKYLDSFVEARKRLKNTPPDFIHLVFTYFWSKAFRGDDNAFITGLDRAESIMRVVAACYESDEKGEEVSVRPKS